MTPEQAERLLYEYLSFAEPPQPADAVLAFGSYHTPVAHTAARLVLEGYAPLLVCSGATSALTQSLVGSSEADFFADIAEKDGVDPARVLREPASTNTGENVSFSFRLLRSRGIDPKTVLACGMPPHLRRIVATIAKQEPSVRTIPILVPFERTDYLTKAGMGYQRRLVGELERLQDYPALGHTAPVAIPPYILEAKEVLLRLYP